MTPYDPVKLYNTIKELEIIPEKELDKAVATSKEKKLPLDTILVNSDLVSDQFLGKIISDLLGIPFITLAKTTIPKEILNIIPGIVAKKKSVIPFKRDEKGLHIATSYPKQNETIEFVARKTGENIQIYYATLRDIEDALGLYEQEIGVAFEEIVQAATGEQAKTSIEQTPIKKVVDTIVLYAQTNKASDIHITSRETQVVIRYRIDGILHDIATIPKTLQDKIVSRIKVMASLRTDEHQAPQDGKIKWRPDNDPTSKLDMRVSIIPTTNGEKVVMRLLSEQARGLTLEDLGLSADNLEKVKKAIKSPYGMILATGPTGSGKTTSLYAILKILNKPEVNIMTIEDPVEYEIMGVDQIQANPKTNLTFAEGLRSIVRQDPDIILVGEIRDSETADIAVNAAMTGHLVLSTLHTNDAATSFVRLIDMGVEPFLVASTTSVIVAQRLLRQICSSCKVSKEIDISADALLSALPPALVKKYFGEQKLARVFEGKGCEVCHTTGYLHRIGVFEVILVDEILKKAVTEQANVDEIRKIAIDSGMSTMLEDGLQKVQQGKTTIEEVLRVTKE